MSLACPWAPPEGLRESWMRELGKEKRFALLGPAANRNAPMLAANPVHNVEYIGLARTAWCVVNWPCPHTPTRRATV
ncbi:hypothetical protein D554_3842 [Bordetella holmesii 30539]|nr:hypothetical protein D554_3842 [Bordetella holmesii 30539]